MAQIGTATVKVLPDLSEFTAALEAIPDGFTVTETIEYKRNVDGQIMREIRTKTVRRS